MALVPGSSPHCLTEFRAGPLFNVQIEAHRATRDDKAGRDLTGAAGKQFPFRVAGISQRLQTASQKVRFGACLPYTKAISQRHRSSHAIRQARSAPSPPKSCRQCMNRKHATQGFLLTPLMIQSMKRPRIFRVCLDTSCLQAHHPPSTAMVHIKTQWKHRKEFKGTKMNFWYFRKCYRRKRGKVGPLLKLGSLSVDRSEVPYVIALVTTSQVSQAFEL